MYVFVCSHLPIPCWFQPGRTYILEDTQGYALEWVKAIEEVRVHTYGGD